MNVIKTTILQSNPDLVTVKIATNLNLPTKKSLLIKNRQNSNIPDLATYFRIADAVGVRNDSHQGPCPKVVSETI